MSLSAETRGDLVVAIVRSDVVCDLSEGTEACRAERDDYGAAVRMPVILCGNAWTDRYYGNVEFGCYCLLLIGCCCSVCGNYSVMWL